DPPARSSTKDTNAVKGPSAPPTRRRTPFTAPPGRVPGSPSVGGADVLVDVEHVLRVVLPLDPREPVVVAAVGRPHPLLAFVHHEVDIRAARRGRVQRLPVVPRPLRD